MYEIELVEEVKFQPLENVLFNDLVLGNKISIYAISNYISSSFLVIGRNILVMVR